MNRAAYHVAFALLALAAVAPAADECPRLFPALVTAVVDGDTVDATVDLGLDVQRTVRVRLAGVDTPELHGPTLAAGREARAFLRDWIAVRSNRVRLQVEGRDKYGRIVGRLIGHEGGDASRALLDAHQAIPYGGSP